MSAFIYFEASRPGGGKYRLKLGINLNRLSSTIFDFLSRLF